MIAMLRGVVAHHGEDQAVIDVGGVGYLVYMPNLVAKEMGEGTEVLIHISTQVREDAITLYGFMSIEDRDTFEMLREVNGVGPRTALSILSQIPRETFHRAIAERDVKTLIKLKGLGKKTAERLCLELENKVSRTFAPVTQTPEAKRVVPQDPLPLALARLDYRKTEIDLAMSSADVPGFNDAPVGARLQAALRVLSGPMARRG